MYRDGSKQREKWKREEVSHQSKLALKQSRFEDQQSGPRSVGVEMATGRGQWRMGKKRNDLLGKGSSQRGLRDTGKRLVSWQIALG